LDESSWTLPGLRVLTSSEDVQHERFEEPLGNAEAARVELDLSMFPTQISALDDSGNLIEAEIDYVGEVRLRTSGDQIKRVALERQSSGITFTGLNAGRYSWDIGLNAGVPLELIIDGGSGSAALDLAALTLDTLALDGSSGASQTSLPGGTYDVRYDGGTGSARFDIEDGADVTFQLDMSSGSVRINTGAPRNLDLRMNDGGSGSVTVTVPEGSAIRVSVRDSGSGSVRLPSDLETIQRGDGDEGSWESEGYDEADERITLVVDDMGSGSVTVAYD
jgi:hypothetical protein